MIRSLADVSRIAAEKGPKKLAVLAPEDEEFMLAVKKELGGRAYRTGPHREFREDGEGGGKGRVRHQQVRKDY
mgnify:CR=1 FL=1